MKWILAFPGVLMFSTWCHHWSHRAPAVPTNIVYQQHFLFTRHEPGHIYFLISSDSGLHWHITEPIKLVLCQQTAAPQYFSTVRLVTSAFQNFPWCSPPGSSLQWHNAIKECYPHSTSFPPAMRLATSVFHSLPCYSPLIPLRSLSQPVAISMGQRWAHRTCAVPTKIAPSQYFSSTSQEICHICVLWPSVMQSSYSSLLPLRTMQQSPLAQRWAHRTRTGPTRIAPPQYFSSTSQDTGYTCIPQHSMMQSSYSSLLPLRIGRNLHWHSTEHIGLVLSVISSHVFCKPFSLSISWTASSSSSACGVYWQRTHSTIYLISKYLFLYDVAVLIRSTSSWCHAVYSMRSSLYCFASSFSLLNRHVRNMRGTDRLLYSWIKSICFSSPLSICSQSSSLFWLL